MRRWKKKNVGSMACIFWGFVILFMLAVGFLTYQQCVVPVMGVRKYYADTGVHMQIAEKQLLAHRPSYSLLFIILKCFFSLTHMSWQGTSLLFAVLMALCAGSTVWLISLWYTRYYKISPSGKVYFFSVCACLVSMIFTTYQKATSPNVWHNPTQFISRPLCFGVIFCVYSYWEKSQSGKADRKYLWANAVLSTLSMLAKPSFLSAFLPAVCLCLLSECVKTKGKSFFSSLQLGISFVPSLFVLWFQSRLLFGNGQGNAVAFGFHGKAGTMIWGIFASSAFCLFGWLVLWAKKKDKRILGFVGVWYATGLWVRFFFREIGQRAADGNFVWGYMLMLFFVFIYLAGELFISPENEKSVKKPIRMLGFALYGLHLGFGVWYFIQILRGASFLTGLML